MSHIPYIFAALLIVAIPLSNEIRATQYDVERLSGKPYLQPLEITYSEFVERQKNEGAEFWFWEHVAFVFNLRDDTDIDEITVNGAIVWKARQGKQNERPLD